MSFWKRLLLRRAEDEEVETPAERSITEGRVEDFAADRVTWERLGGVDPERILDDEFKP